MNTNHECNHLLISCACNNFYKLSCAGSMKCFLPEPASVVPKPEVQHLVPWGKFLSTVGRQAGWTLSGKEKCI